MSQNTLHFDPAVLGWFIAIFSAIWVFRDAQALGVRKGLVRGLGNMGPRGWSIAVLLLWFPAFFLYLWYRPKFVRALAGVGAASEPTVAERAAAAAAPAQATASPAVPLAAATASPAEASPAQRIFWAVILLLTGLALAGWGAWNSYADIDTYVSARSALRQLQQITPEAMQQAQREFEQSGDFFSAFGAAILSSPGAVDIVKMKTRAEMEQASHDLAQHGPMLLLGLWLIWVGNRRLGRPRR